MAQTQVSGTVVSGDDGQPIVGATIRVVGTNTGTVTDVDGKFAIPVPNGSKITVSYIGMNAKTVNANENMTITLNPDDASLDEVIVTGYGNFKKTSFTGAASTLSTDKLQDVPATSIQSKLAGGVSGVTITSSSGAPGAMSDIRVRGMGSINAGNDPLYVIDGTPMLSQDVSGFGRGSYNDIGTNPLSTINPNDIENITVIKDAAAASLYGSRAANGVIVITTKSGAAGKTQVNFRSDWGFSNMAVDYRPMLGGQARRDLLTLGLKNQALYDGTGKLEQVDSETGLPLYSSADDYAAKNIDRYAAIPETGWTNWKDLLFKTGKRQNYEATISGGSEKTQFYASLGYLKQGGIVANQGMERFTGNLNLTHKFGRFTLRLNSLLSRMNQQVANEQTSYDGALANYAFFQNPSTIAYNPDGTLATGGGISMVNPLFENLHSYDRSYINRAYNTVQLTWNIWDKLNLSEKIAYDYTGGIENDLWDKQSNNGGPGGVFQRVLSTFEQLNTQTQLTYINTFGKHNVDALLGFETEDFTWKNDYAVGTDYPGEIYELRNAGTTSADSFVDEDKLVSFLGRVNYNYDNKYYGGVSYRVDGSSRLAPDQRWGSFWSLSGAWRFGEEGFMKSVKNWLTDGKLRVSYGENGTRPSDYYGYMKLYSFGQYYNGGNGMVVTNPGNPALTWEKNKAWNFGLDLTFFNRLNVTFDYYTRTSSNLIMDMPISAIPGLSYNGLNPTQPVNIGALRNSGFELTLQSNNINTKDFTWTTSLNIAHNSNKVLELNGQSEIISGVLIHKVGQPYNSYYMYEYAGVDAQTGKELYYINGDGDDARNTTVNLSEANMTTVGNNQTTIEGGLSNNMVWKFIDFGFTFTYALGGDAFDYATWQHGNGSTNEYNGAVPTLYDINDIWSGPGDTAAKLPIYMYGNTSHANSSSRWLMPLDYLRLKNLTLGFSVPTKYIRHLGLNKVRAYFSGENLLTFKSSVLTVDPEVPTNGLCTFETPALRTFTFGIQIGF